MTALRHLISIEDLDVDQLDLLLDTTQAMLPIARREARSAPTLRGKVVCNLFLEDSTRTRISFDLAAKRLSAEVINFSGKGSSVSKGESFKDTVLTLAAMGVDAVVVRSASSGAPVQLASYLLDVPVLNAGDGWHQHPTQALLDVFTMRQHLAPGTAGSAGLHGRRLAVVGDVLHSRVARSLVQAARLARMEVVLVAPPTLLPPQVADWGVEVARDLDAVLPEVDAVELLRVQRERMHRAYFPTTREYAAEWGIDSRRLDLLRPGAIVLHPGPMNRGVEITADVADAPQAVITEQVTNGIAVRMACLYLLLAGEAPADDRPATTSATAAATAADVGGAAGAVTAATDVTVDVTTGTGEPAASAGGVRGPNGQGGNP